MSQRARQDKRGQLIGHLLDAIRAGRFVAGEKLPAERQLAGDMGTTSVTVGRAMRELVAAGVVERKVGAGSFLTENGVRMVTGTTINVLTGSHDVEPIRSFRRLCTDIIHEYGWIPNLIRVTQRTLGAATAGGRLFPYNVVMWSRFAEDPSLKRTIERHSCLSVLVGALEHSVFDVIIRADDSASVRMAVEHLRTKGCKAVGLIAEPPDSAIHELMIALWRSTQPMTETFSDDCLITIAPGASVEKAITARLSASSFPVDGLVCPLKWIPALNRAIAGSGLRDLPIVALARAGTVPEELDVSHLSGIVANDLERHVRTALELIRRNIETGWKPADTQRMHLIPPRFRHVEDSR